MIQGVMTPTVNEYDMICDFSKHYKNGNVWRVIVDLSMKGADEEPEYFYSVAVDVVSPTRDLATYIASTMYPDSSSISVPDEPLTA